MRAANDRLRNAVADEGDDDFTNWPLAKWRERWHDKEIQRLFFENFIYVRDAFDENKLVPFRMNRIQRHLHENLSGRDAILKARRGGVSTYFQARYLATAVVQSGREVHSIPHDPDTEEKFRDVYKIMFENLPPHLRPETKYYSDDLIHIKDGVKGTIDSRVRAATVQPGHEGKGRGQTITHLHLTEMPFWRGDQKKAFTSLTEAAAGGEISLESTAYGIELFHATYTQGKRSEGGWKSFFFEWWWRENVRIAGASFARGRKQEWVLLQPGETLSDVWSVPAISSLSEADRVAKRDRFDRAKLTKEEIEVSEKILAHLVRFGELPKKAAWHTDAIAEYIAWRRVKIDELPGGEAQFKVEYPESDVDCFEQTGRPVIQGRYLKVTCQAQEDPIQGHEYGIGVDTSLGHDSGDWSAIEVIDITSGRQVHSERLKRSPDLLAYRVAELHEHYNWATCVVERNNTGIATIRELQRLIPEEYIFRYLDRRLQRKIEDGELTADEAMEQAEFGLPTTSANKADYAIELERSIRRGEIGLSSEEWCEEARTVVWFDNEKWGAVSSSYHDDRVIALALIVYVRMKLRSQMNVGVEVMPATGWAR